MNYNQKGKDSQVNCIELIFSRVTEENKPKLRKGLPIQIQGAHRTTENIRNYKRFLIKTKNKYRDQKRGLEL